MPQTNFEFPERHFIVRFFRLKDINSYLPLIVHSVKENDVFYLACIFFPTQPSHGSQANEDSVERVKTKRSILKTITKSIKFSGRNGIPVRGHQDVGALNSSDISKESRNLRSLINFRRGVCDKTLENHLNTCSKKCNTYFKNNTN